MSHQRPTRTSILLRWVLPGLAILATFGWGSKSAVAEDWTATATLIEATSLSDDDASGEDDIYWRVSIAPTLGSGTPASCSSFSSHVDDRNHITPGWTCTANVTGGPDTTVQIVIALWEHDSTSADDHFDINPNPSTRDLTIAFKPKTFNLSMNVAGFETFRCMPGQIRVRGLNGDDRAEVVFALSASSAGAPSGDSDGDGLLDVAEVCGLDSDSDGVVDVDLPGLGADPARKDVFVEIDWMVNNTGIPATQHTHEPWLPALMIAWNEFNAAPVTNPTMAGTPSRSGIALHVDVGTLYAGYAMDFDGNGTADLTVNPAGNVDLDGDGIADIGDLASLGTGTLGGGNPLPEDPLLSPDTTGSFFAAGSDFGAIKAANFNPLRDLVFHYAVFGDQYPSVPPGSSGRAESCALPACNDFFVTLSVVAGWTRQTVDANRDGIPDPGGALLAGPSGLPVDGSVAEHAGTFLHELGHNLSLGHGGSDGINYKPNYLSVMNYRWQIPGLSFDFDGDVIGDPVGVDFDGDGIIDLRRFMYSSSALPNLQETSLNEPAGLGGANILSAYTCPAVGMPPAAPVLIAPSAGPIDWNCDGNTTAIGVVADVNFEDGSGISVAPLTGSNDATQIATTGLAFQAAAPNISPQELRDMLTRTQRVAPVTNRKDAQARCAKLKTIDFEDLSAGIEVSAQYGPLATFLNDELRTPKIIGPDDRGGTPTSSPKMSLRNEFAKAGQPAPLVVDFDPPQRQVSFYTGRTMASERAARVVLQAFDVNGLNMGVVTTPLPSEREGVTKFLGAAAIFPDQLIKRFEIRYETLLRPSLTAPSPTQWVILDEPQQIDDLTLCQDFKPSERPPVLPPQPKFGDLKVDLLVKAVMLVEGAGGDTEAGHRRLVERPLAAPVVYDDSSGTTDLTITKSEGTRVNLSAPLSVGGGHFLHWQFDGSVSFGDGQRDVALTLLRPGTVTAVYLNDKSKEPRHEPRCKCLEMGEEPRHEPRCDCLEKCCESDEHQ